MLASITPVRRWDLTARKNGHLKKHAHLWQLIVTFLRTLNLVFRLCKLSLTRGMLLASSRGTLSLTRDTWHDVLNMWHIVLVTWHVVHNTWHMAYCP